MSELRLHCDATGHETVLTVSGELEAHRCGLLRESLDMALAIRPNRPLVIDLAGVRRIGLVAQACVARVLLEARRSQRKVTLRNVPEPAGPIFSAYRPDRPSAVLAAR